MTTDGLFEPFPPMPMQIDPSLFYSLTLLSKSRSCALERDKKEKEKRKRKKKGGCGGFPPTLKLFSPPLSDDTTKEDAEIASIHDGTSRVGKGRSRGAYTDGS
jgi:hypothetical protein